MPLLSPSITTFQLFHKCNLELTANATEFSFLLLCMCSVTSVMSDSVISWTIAHQAPLSTGFSRQEYWSGLPAALRCGHSESRKREEQHRLFHNGISVDISLDKVSLLEKAEETGLALVLFCWVVADRGDAGMGARGSVTPIIFYDWFFFVICF